MDEGLGELRVLLVDDNEHMRAIVCAILKGIGVRHIREARDGGEGLEMVRQWNPDLAIVDFRMDPVDGVEFTRLVRNADDSANPYLPIIMMTGFADRPRVVEARDAGVTELVVKPVTARSIIDRLNAVVFRPRPFVKTSDYFGPRRRGIDDVAIDDPDFGNTLRI
ncbi:MAG: response regulator [Caulobacter sp.]|jgi:two-component system chemotaxis response regulator CheY|nr:response regulator [Caulobacter sp.]